MKKFTKIFAAAVMLIVVAMLSGCGTFTCDFCHKEVSGDKYYRGITKSENALDACRDCASSYWAPLNVENFKK